MDKRALTLEEIKATINALADKVTMEGQKLYGEIRNKVNELMENLDMIDLDVELDDLWPKFNALKDMVSVEGAELIDHLQDRLDELLEDVEEEIAELEEKGLVEWIRDNKALAGGVALAVVVLVVLILL